jgi:multimeric flavodoxin WrbA
MTILAINGSPRAKGNTSIMLEWVLAELTKEGFNTELIEAAAEPVQGCVACGFCGKSKNGTCRFKDDTIGSLIPKAHQARAIILGSPVYFADLTPWLKAFIDRVGLVSLNSGNPLKRKPGAAVVVARRAGHVHTYDSINHFFGITEMIAVGSSYWNLGVGRDEGDVKNDEEAKQTMVNLGQNMAWLLKKIAR